MTANPPAQSWVKIRIALIWILARDSAKVAMWSRSLQEGNLHPWEEEDDWDARTDRNWSNAWHSLKTVVAIGSVDIRGEPYEELPSGHVAPKQVIPNDFFDENSDLEEEEEDEDREDAEPLKSISRQEAAHLVLDCTHGFRLRPDTWALKGGTGWTCVEVSLDNLLQEFPSPNSAEGPDLITKSSDHKRHPVVAAFLKLYPNGLPPGVRVADRDAEIKKQVKVNTGWEPSDATIRRALYREKKKRK